MEHETARAIYTNLYLLASADGRIDPAERDYLGRFAEAAGISEDQSAIWRGEVEAGANQFLPVGDAEVAETGLAVMARMVRVDGEFGAQEQAAYVNLGKALGWDQEKLGEVLREYWDRDPLDLVKAPDKTAAPSTGGRTGIAIGDDMGDAAALSTASGELALELRGMDELHRVEAEPDLVVFHVAEERPVSSSRLDALRERFPKSLVAFVARRDQAPQIGFLLGKGADRCFVEPLYHGEIGKALGEMLDAR